MPSPNSNAPSYAVVTPPYEGWDTKWMLFRVSLDSRHAAGCDRRQAKPKERTMSKSLKDLQALLTNVDLVGFERGPAGSIKVGSTKVGATKGGPPPAVD